MDFSANNQKLHTLFLELEGAIIKDVKAMDHSGEISATEAAYPYSIVAPHLTGAESPRKGEWKGKLAGAGVLCLLAPEVAYALGVGYAIYRGVSGLTNALFNRQNY